MDRLIAYFEKHVPLVNEALDRFLPKEDMPPEVLHEAMRYSALAEAKRMRPLLCLMSAGACGAEAGAAMPAACALELVHTYSLIHDDLPAMDDDEMRRGRLTCHKAFNEAIAILAGDALLTLAFEILAEGYPAERAMPAVLALSRAAGSAGMVGGQILDLEGEEQAPSLKAVEAIHRRKTGALIEASCLIGGIITAASEEELAALRGYGRSLGLLYQITDDLLDVQSTTAAIGKTAGKDAAQHKMTYPSLMSIEQATECAKDAAAEAKNALKGLGKGALMLRLLADFVVGRKK